MMSYANYLYIAIRAAVDAGKSIMDIYNDPESDFGIERKADNSPLTKADKAAHQPGVVALGEGVYGKQLAKGTAQHCTATDTL